LRPTVSNRPGQQHRAEEVGDAPRDQVCGRGRVRDAEAVGDDQRRGEQHGVVEERLGGQQGEAEEGAARVAAEHGAGDLAEPGGLALLDLDRLALRLGQPADVVAHPALDVADEPLGLLLAAVDDQPAWALGHVAADDQDQHAHQRAEAERQSPAEVDGEDARVQHEQRAGEPERRAQPVGAVDRQVDAAAVLGGDQLVDRGVDRGVLAADAEAGEEARQRERGKRPRERRGDGGHQVERRA
jgi:hypothetical protein